jgi:hypothetical protein
MVSKIVRLLIICGSLALLSSCNWLDGPDRWLMNDSGSQPTEVENQIILIDTPVATPTLTPVLTSATPTPNNPTLVPHPSETTTSKIKF